MTGNIEVNFADLGRLGVNVRRQGPVHRSTYGTTATHHVSAWALLGVALLAGACTDQQAGDAAADRAVRARHVDHDHGQPDVVTQDGASQSLVTITARDTNGQPLRNLSLRAEIAVNGVARRLRHAVGAQPRDRRQRPRLGDLHRAAAAGAASTPATDVQILVTPLGTRLRQRDAARSPRSASCRRRHRRAAARQRDAEVHGDAGRADRQRAGAVRRSTSTSTHAEPIVQWLWNFGDGSTGVRAAASSTRSGRPGTFAVTLTVVDSIGASELADAERRRRPGRAADGHLHRRRRPARSSASRSTSTRRRRVRRRAARSAATRGTSATAPPASGRRPRTRTRTAAPTPCR